MKSADLRTCIQIPHDVLRHYKLISINPGSSERKKNMGKILKSLIILGEFCVEAQARNACMPAEPEKKTGGEMNALDRSRERGNR
jgi:hypothetical protein